MKLKVLALLILSLLSSSVSLAERASSTDSLSYRGVMGCKPFQDQQGNYIQSEEDAPGFGLDQMKRIYVMHTVSTLNGIGIQPRKEKIYEVAQRASSSDVKPHQNFKNFSCQYFRTTDFLIATGCSRNNTSGVGGSGGMIWSLDGKYRATCGWWMQCRDCDLATQAN